MGVMVVAMNKLKELIQVFHIKFSDRFSKIRIFMKYLLFNEVLNLLTTAIKNNSVYRVRKLFIFVLKSIRK